jgi:hypothetical protein
MEGRDQEIVGSESRNTNRQDSRHRSPKPGACHYGGEEQKEEWMGEKMLENHRHNKR